MDSEKRRAQRIAVGVVEVKRYRFDRLTASSFPSCDKMWYIEKPQAEIPRVERWV